jgi:pyridoxamine 5'-phosphate oxidase family protein
MQLSPTERAYVRERLLGRLATVDARGAPQNNPVGVFVDEATGDLLVGGLDLARTRKFRNVQGNPYVAIVIDDLVSTSPWTVRGVEVRGTAEALEDVDPPRPGMSRAVIRIHPEWVGTWGLDPEAPGLTVRRAA